MAQAWMRIWGVAYILGRVIGNRFGMSHLPQRIEASLPSDRAVH